MFSYEAQSKAPLYAAIDGAAIVQNTTAETLE